MSAPRIGLALIARDEADQLPALLASIEGAFDRVVLLDTGSTDRTVEIFESWADAERLKAGDAGFTWEVGRFEWCEDFAAARQAADQLLGAGVDWTCWADADDVIHGAEHLRALAAQAPGEVSAFVVGYDYAQDADGRCVCYLRRERLVRRGRGRWHGRLHEAQLIDGPVAGVDAEHVEWRHRKTISSFEASSERNLRMLTEWAQSEPDNPRVLGYLGSEQLARGHAADAEGLLRRCLELTSDWDEERAQLHRKLALSLLLQERVDDAIGVALQAVALLPTWPDSYLTLAEAALAQGEPVKTLHWAREVLRHGTPSTLLIVNPDDYQVTPRVLLAEAHAALGDVDEAISHAEHALQLGAGPGVAQRVAQWHAVRKRESTAAAFLAAADTLCAHDEQAKALVLLEQTVPHYATDHPNVVARRSELRERLYPLYQPDGYADHYEYGGSKPEDFIADDQVDALCEALPRAGFLLRGLRELEAAA